MSANDAVARRLEAFADFEEARGADYRPQAYRRAAENVRSHHRDVADLAGEGPEAIREIEGVGETIAGKIVEYVETGEIEELAELREELPVDMAALTAVEGVGPTTVGTLYGALGITSLDDLEAAAREGRIREVEGFGETTEANILENVAFARQARERQRLGRARPLGERIRDALADHDAVERVELAGSLRRWTETIGDVDVLVATTDREAVVDAFTDWGTGGSTDVIEAGTAKASIRVDGVRVDLRNVDPAEFGSALQYFTGSREHNIHFRNLAIERGLKVNEYGVFDVSDPRPDDRSDAAADGDVAEVEDADPRAGERIGGATEAEMYGALEMAVVPPEIREDGGELEAARAGRLPELVTVGAVRGDLHTHTDRSDGDASLAKMVEAAERRGYDYYAVTDHAEGPGVVGSSGLSPAEISEQRAAVEELAADADLELLHGIEANVDADGEVVPGGELLEGLDIVVASPHSALSQNREAATDRLVAAVEHPAVDVLGHPTGRLINRRPGLELDAERLAAAAADAGTALEVNANPSRLDANGDAVRVAVEAGATVAVNTDAHTPDRLDLLRYGVHTARRGWAEASDVLNTYSLPELRSFLD